MKTKILGISLFVLTAAIVAGYPSLVGRFRGGSTPDDDIPSVDEILDVLVNSRQHLLSTISTFDEADLATGLRYREDLIAKHPEFIDAVGCALFTDARETVMKFDQQLRRQSIHLVQAIENVILGALDVDFQHIDPVMPESFHH